jgi:hypothetical protein
MKIMIIIIVNYFVWKSDFFTQKTMTNELLIRHTYYTIIDWHCIVLSLRKMLTSVPGALVKELHTLQKKKTNLPQLSSHGYGDCR